jgi:hypothetical protein
MNIFFLDTNPRKIAEYHCDKHVVKMILETAQLLCGTHWVCGSEAPYKLSHKNHPCSKWVRESDENYEYLCEIGLALCEEYTHRYGKIHKSEAIIEWCANNVPMLPRDVGSTKPAMAMPDEYKVGYSVVKSYRNYYNGAKADFAKWTKRETPEWFNKKEELCN